MERRRKDWERGGDYIDGGGSGEVLRTSRQEHRGKGGSFLIRPSRLTSHVEHEGGDGGEGEFLVVPVYTEGEQVMVGEDSSHESPGLLERYSTGKHQTPLLK